MKISVITASWNSAQTIRDTLRSVNAQTHADVEHVVVDGGSTDETMEIVRAEGRRLGPVISEPDRGIYDAMNKGIRLASGEVVGLLNSDDFFASDDVLADVAAVFECDPELDLLWGDLCYVDRLDSSRVVRYWRSSEFLPGSFAKGWAPPHPTLYARRRVYERLGTFDLSYSIAADVELMMRFLEIGRPRSAYLPKTLVRMRMGGTTNKSLKNVVRQNVEICSALRRHQLPFSMLRYVGGKLVSRGSQFVRRPEA